MSTAVSNSSAVRMAALRRLLPVGLLAVVLPVLVCSGSAAAQVTAECAAAAGRDITARDIIISCGLTEEQVRTLVRELYEQEGPLADKIAELAEALGVTKASVRNLFRILGEEQVPPEGLLETLAEIAERHKAMLERLAVLDPEDPAIAGLIEEARAAIEAGAYDEADRLLAAAEDAELAAVRMAEELAHQAQEAADRRRLSAAATRAERGELARTRLDYRTAAEHFETAAELVPASAPLVRADYLGRFGLVAQDAGDYAAAEGVFGEQPRRALPGHRPLRRRRAAPRARPRYGREGARAGPPRHRHRRQ